MEVEFFEPSTRTPNERTDLCKNVSPEMFSKDYMHFGYDYFDNKEYFVGYQGYKYDGRFRKTAEKMIGKYGLKKGDKVLELGCAKGFLLVEFHNLGMQVTGVDLSEYAVKNSHLDIRDKIKQSRLVDMDFDNDYFDLVISKEVIPHIPLDELKQVMKETTRISKGNIFHMIQCGRDEKELDLMKKWDNTHKMLMTPEQWKKFFEDNNYKCDYQFKFLTI